MAAYPRTLKEVNRRWLFNDLLAKEYDRILSFARKEMEERKAFLGTYGEAIPIDFLPELKLMPNILSVDLSLENLPQVTDQLLSNEGAS